MITLDARRIGFEAMVHLSGIKRWGQVGHAGGNRSMEKLLYMLFLRCFCKNSFFTEHGIYKLFFTLNWRRVIAHLYLRKVTFVPPLCC